MDHCRRLLLFGQRKWIMDIHNGISNPNFTYADTFTIVPDENGILRRTPAGYPAVEGGRWAATLAEGALLGPELITDVNLDNGAYWTISETNPASDVTFSGGTARLQSNGTLAEIATPVILTTALIRYKYTVVCTAHGSGALTVGIGGAEAVGVVNTVGTFTGELVSIGGVTAVLKRQSVCDVTITSFSIREVIPQWYAPTLGATRSIATRKGLRQIQTSEAFEGMLIEPAMTNKCTCMKSNPTGLAGIAFTGGASGAVVNDAAALTAAGLSDICTAGNVYEFTIPALGAVYFSGATANLNAHSSSAYSRQISGTSGTVTLGQASSPRIPITSSDYLRVKQENIIPYSNTVGLILYNGSATTQAVVRLILPQLEESPFCTSIIAPAADTAAAQTRAASVVSASTSGVFPSTGQDFSLFLERVATAAGQTATLLSTRVDADNLISVSTTATAVGVNLRKTATDNAASAAYTHTAAEKFQAIIVKSAMGISVKVREYSSGAWQAWGAWVNNETAGAKATSPIGTTYQIGALNNLSQFAGNYPRTAIIAMPPKATLAEYQAWIAQELTLRGLI